MLNETEREVQRHPAFGMLQIHRISGSGENLFGSSIEHNHCVRLRICRGSVHRDLHHDWYHDEGVLIEIDMSANQFAEAITSLNCGVGTPCTLRWVNGQDVPEIEQKENMLKQANEDMKATVKSLAKRMDETIGLIKSLMDKKTLSKKDQAEVQMALKVLEEHFKSNIPFVHKCFQEKVENTVTDAKAELETFYTHSLIRLGQEALQAKLERAELGKPVMPELPFNRDENDDTADTENRESDR